MKMLKALILAVLMVLVAVPLAGAQGGGKWDSSFTVINLGTAQAQVTVLFIKEDGTQVTVTKLGTSGGEIDNPFTLDSGKSVEILLFLTTQLDPGRYSVVLSSTEPVAAIANLTNTVASPPQSPSYSGSYSGLEDVGQLEMYMPAVVKDYYEWDSHISIQNLTNAPLDINVKLYAEGTATVCSDLDYPGTPAYASVYLNLDELALVGCDIINPGDGYNGSAVISANGPVGAVDNQTADKYGMTATYRGFTPDQATQKYYVPALYVGYYNWDSSINIQNVGTVATVVNVTYSDGVTNSCDLDPMEGCNLYNPSEAGHDQKFSAVVEAAQAGAKLVVVAQAGTSVVSGLNQAFAYEGFNENAGGTVFGLPLTMDMYYGWFTSFTVQNVGTGDATFQYTYAPDPLVGFGGQTCTYPDPVPAGANVEIVQTQDACVDLPAGYHGGVTINATAGTIIVIVSQNNVEQMLLRPGDWSMSYDGISQ